MIGTGAVSNLMKRNKNLVIQIQIYPGDYAIPIILGDNPNLPETNEWEVVESITEEELKQMLNDKGEFSQEKVKSYYTKKSEQIRDKDDDKI